MPKAVSKLILFAVILAFVTLVIWWLFPSNQRQITKAFQEITDLASFGKAETVLTKALSAQNLAEHFTPEASIAWRWLDDSRQQQITGRATIRERALAARSASAGLQFAVHDLEIMVNSKNKQVAEASGILTMEETAVGDKWVWKINTDWKKLEKEWRLEKLEAEPIPTAEWWRP